MAFPVLIESAVIIVTLTPGRNKRLFSVQEGLADCVFHTMLMLPAVMRLLPLWSGSPGTVCYREAYY